jgi:hypothetical protein
VATPTEPTTENILKELYSKESFLAYGDPTKCKGPYCHAIIRGDLAEDNKGLREILEEDELLQTKVKNS